ncbi:UvrD-helicase domain-containing protein [Nocardia sp. 004]|uniref:UvrD-helicase domain-containing protein n=1 Tax=Nocardia sp. 004 TaxID=3385978 RepID=UPI0039A25B2C
MTGGRGIGDLPEPGPGDTSATGSRSFEDAPDLSAVVVAPEELKVDARLRLTGGIEEALREIADQRRSGGAMGASFVQHVSHVVHAARTTPHLPPRKLARLERVVAALHAGEAVELVNETGVVTSNVVDIISDEATYREWLSSRSVPAPQAVSSSAGQLSEPEAADSAAVIVADEVARTELFAAIVAEVVAEATVADQAAPRADREQFLTQALPIVEDLITAHLRGIGAGNHQMQRVAGAVLDNFEAHRWVVREATEQLWHNQGHSYARHRRLVGELVDGIASVGTAAPASAVQSIIDEATALSALPEIEQQEVVQAALDAIGTATSLDYHTRGYAAFNPLVPDELADPAMDPGVAEALWECTGTTAVEEIRRKFSEGWSAARADHLDSIAGAGAGAGHSEQGHENLNLGRVDTDPTNPVDAADATIPMGEGSQRAPEDGDDPPSGGSQIGSVGDIPELSPVAEQPSGTGQGDDVPGSHTDSGSTSQNRSRETGIDQQSSRLLPPRKGDEPLLGPPQLPGRSINPSDGGTTVTVIDEPHRKPPQAALDKASAAHAVGWGAEHIRHLDTDFFPYELILTSPDDPARILKLTWLLDPGTEQYNYDRWRSGFVIDSELHAGLPLTEVTRLFDTLHTQATMPALFNSDGSIVDELRTNWTQTAPPVISEDAAGLLSPAPDKPSTIDATFADSEHPREEVAELDAAEIDPAADDVFRYPQVWRPLLFPLPAQIPADLIAATALADEASGNGWTVTSRFLPAVRASLVFELRMIGQQDSHIQDVTLRWKQRGGVWEFDAEDSSSTNSRADLDTIAQLATTPVTRLRGSTAQILDEITAEVLAQAPTRISSGESYENYRDRATSQVTATVTATLDRFIADYDDHGPTPDPQRCAAAVAVRENRLAVRALSAAITNRIWVDGDFALSDLAEIRCAVEDHAHKYAWALGEEGAVRYTTEGHLHAVCARAGNRPVWLAVEAEVASRREELLPGTERQHTECVAARRAARDATTHRLREQAQQLLFTGEAPQAQRLLVAAAQISAADPLTAALQQVLDEHFPLTRQSPPSAVGPEPVNAPLRYAQDCGWQVEQVVDPEHVAVYVLRHHDIQTGNRHYLRLVWDGHDSEPVYNPNACSGSRISRTHNSVNHVAGALPLSKARRLIESVAGHEVAAPAVSNAPVAGEELSPDQRLLLWLMTEQNHPNEQLINTLADPGYYMPALFEDDGLFGPVDQSTIEQTRPQWAGKNLNYRIRADLIELCPASDHSSALGSAAVVTVTRAELTAFADSMSSDQRATLDHHGGIQGRQQLLRELLRIDDLLNTASASETPAAERGFAQISHGLDESAGGETISGVDQHTAPETFPTAAAVDPDSGTTLIEDEFAVLAAASHHVIRVERTSSTIAGFPLGEPGVLTPVAAGINTVTSLLEAQLLQINETKDGEEVSCTPAGDARLRVLQRTSRTDPMVGDRVLNVVTGGYGVVCGYNELDDTLRWAEIVWEPAGADNRWNDDVEPADLVVIQASVMTAEAATELYRSITLPPPASPVTAESLPHTNSTAFEETESGPGSSTTAGVPARGHPGADASDQAAASDTAPSAPVISDDDFAALCAAHSGRLVIDRDAAVMLRDNGTVGAQLHPATVDWWLGEGHLQAAENTYILTRQGQRWVQQQERILHQHQPPDVGDQVLALASGRVGVVCGFQHEPDGGRVAVEIVFDHDSPTPTRAMIPPRYLTTVAPAAVAPDIVADLVAAAAPAAPEPVPLFPDPPYRVAARPPADPGTLFTTAPTRRGEKKKKDRRSADLTPTQRLLLYAHGGWPVAAALGNNPHAPAQHLFQCDYWDSIPDDVLRMRPDWARCRITVARVEGCIRLYFAGALPDDHHAATVTRSQLTQFAKTLPSDLREELARCNMLPVSNKPSGPRPTQEEQRQLLRRALRIDDYEAAFTAATEAYLHAELADHPKDPTPTPQIRPPVPLNEDQRLLLYGVNSWQLAAALGAREENQITALCQQGFSGKLHQRVLEYRPEWAGLSYTFGPESLGWVETAELPASAAAASITRVALQRYAQSLDPDLRSRLADPDSLGHDDERVHQMRHILQVDDITQPHAYIGPELPSTHSDAPVLITRDEQHTGQADTSAPVDENESRLRSSGIGTAGETAVSWAGVQKETEQQVPASDSAQPSSSRTAASEDTFTEDAPTSEDDADAAAEAIRDQLTELIIEGQEFSNLDGDQIGDLFSAAEAAMVGGSSDTSSADRRRLDDMLAAMELSAQAREAVLSLVSVHLAQTTHETAPSPISENPFDITGGGQVSVASPAVNQSRNDDLSAAEENPNPTHGIQDPAGSDPEKHLHLTEVSTSPHRRHSTLSDDQRLLLFAIAASTSGAGRLIAALRNSDAVAALVSDPSWRVSMPPLVRARRPQWEGCSVQAVGQQLRLGKFGQPLPDEIAPVIVTRSELEDFVTSVAVPEPPPSALDEIETLMQGLLDLDAIEPHIFDIDSIPTATFPVTVTKRPGVSATSLPEAAAATTLVSAAAQDPFLVRLAGLGYPDLYQVFGAVVAEQVITEAVADQRIASTGMDLWALAQAAAQQTLSESSPAAAEETEFTATRFNPAFERFEYGIADADTDDEHVRYELDMTIADRTYTIRVPEQSGDRYEIIFHPTDEEIANGSGATEWDVLGEAENAAQIMPIIHEFSYTTTEEYAAWLAPQLWPAAAITIVEAAPGHGLTVAESTGDKPTTTRGKKKNRNKPQVVEPPHLQLILTRNQGLPGSARSTAQVRLWWDFAAPYGPYTYNESRSECPPGLLPGPGMHLADADRFLSDITDHLLTVPAPSPGNPPTPAAPIPVGDLDTSATLFEIPPTGAVFDETDPPERSSGAAEVPTPEDSSMASVDVAETKQAEMVAVTASTSPPVMLEGEKFPPTGQQQAVYDAVLSGRDVKVQAGAGAGKTSTLEGLARRIGNSDPSARIAYIAFNKSVQVEAGHRMPGNVEPRTGHSIAYRWAPRHVRDRTKQDDALRRPNDVARHLGIVEDIPAGSGEPFLPEEQALAVQRAVDTYATSAADEIGRQHLPSRLRELPAASQDRVVEFARAAWDDLTDKDGQLRLTLDHIRKMWALSRPDLSRPGSGLKRPATVLFFDEAQDTPPVLARVIADQDLPKVIVGDQDQAIYAFTGAVDFLTTAQADIELPLTKSWRFGPEIADIGNRFLQMLGSGKRIEGGGPPSTITEPGALRTPDAILVRSNGGAIAEIVKELDAGRTVGVPKGTKADLIALIETARYLKGQKRPPHRMHEDLAPYRTWDEVITESDKGDDPKLAMLVRIVDQSGIDELETLVRRVYEPDEEVSEDASSDQPVVEFRDTSAGLIAEGDTYPVKDALKEAGFRYRKHPDGGTHPAGKNKGRPIMAWIAVGSPSRRQSVLEEARKLLTNVQPDAEPALDVLVSTAHKAKGLEWDRVRIGDDFKGPTKDPDSDELVMPSPEELRLAYVAVTRARAELDPGALAYVFDYTDINGGIPGQALSQTGVEAPPTRLPHQEVVTGDHSGPVNVPGNEPAASGSDSDTVVADVPTHPAAPEQTTVTSVTETPGSWISVVEVFASWSPGQVVRPEVDQAVNAITPDWIRAVLRHRGYRPFTVSGGGTESWFHPQNPAKMLAIPAGPRHAEHFGQVTTILEHLAGGITVLHDWRARVDAEKWQTLVADLAAAARFTEVELAVLRVVAEDHAHEYLHFGATAPARELADGDHLASLRIRHGRDAVRHALVSYLAVHRGEPVLSWDIDGINYRQDVRETRETQAADYRNQAEQQLQALRFGLARDLLVSAELTDPLWSRSDCTYASLRAAVDATETATTELVEHACAAPQLTLFATHAPWSTYQAFAATAAVQALTDLTTQPPDPTHPQLRGELLTAVAESHSQGRELVYLVAEHARGRGNVSPPNRDYSEPLHLVDWFERFVGILGYTGDGTPILGVHVGGQPYCLLRQGSGDTVEVYHQDGPDLIVLGHVRAVDGITDVMTPIRAHQQELAAEEAELETAFRAGAAVQYSPRPGPMIYRHRRDYQALTYPLRDLAAAAAACGFDTSAHADANTTRLHLAKMMDEREHVELYLSWPTATIGTLCQPTSIHGRFSYNGVGDSSYDLTLVHVLRVIQSADPAQDVATYFRSRYAAAVRQLRDFDGNDRFRGPDRDGFRIAAWQTAGLRWCAELAVNPTANSDSDHEFHTYLGRAESELVAAHRVAAARTLVLHAISADTTTDPVASVAQVPVELDNAIETAVHPMGYGSQPATWREDFTTALTALGVTETRCATAITALDAFFNDQPLTPADADSSASSPPTLPNPRGQKYPADLTELVATAHDNGWRMRFQWTHGLDRPANSLPIRLFRGGEEDFTRIKAVWIRRGDHYVYDHDQASIQHDDDREPLQGFSLTDLTHMIVGSEPVDAEETHRDLPHTVEQPALSELSDDTTTSSPTAAATGIGEQGTATQATETSGDVVDGGDTSRISSVPQPPTTFEELLDQTVIAITREPRLAQIAATNGYARFAETADSIISEFVHDYLFDRMKKAEQDGDHTTVDFVTRIYSKDTNRVPELANRIVEEVWNRLPMAPTYRIGHATSALQPDIATASADQSREAAASSEAANTGDSTVSENQKTADLEWPGSPLKAPDGHPDSGRELDADRQARSPRVGVLENLPAAGVERAAESANPLPRRRFEDPRTDRDADRPVVAPIPADRTHAHEVGDARPSARDRVRTGNLQPAAGVRNRGPGDVTDHQPPVTAASVALTPQQRAQDNLAALRVLRRLQIQKRSATAAERAALDRWHGWGALSALFIDEPIRNAYGSSTDFDRAHQQWQKLASERTQIRQLLTAKQWQAASSSIRTSYYTDPALVKIMWDGVQALGFDGGEFLEPGCGSGRFIEAAPTDTTIPTTAVGVDNETVSAAIAAHRFPDATIVPQGIEKYSAKTGRFALAIGNVPWVDVRPYSKDDNPQRKHALHNLAIITSTRAVRPGGIVALITTRHTLDNTDPTSREAIHRYGDLIGAVRLPVHIHRASSDAEVVTDVLFLRRRSQDAEPADDTWLRSQEVLLPGGDQPQSVNSYFLNHPEQVVGEMRLGPGRFGPALTVTTAPDVDVFAAIDAAVQQITDPVLAIEEDTGDEAEPVADGTLDLDEHGNPTIAEDGQPVALNIHPDHRDQLIALIRIKNQTNGLYAAETATTVAGETPELAALRTELRETYRTYRRSYPPLNKPGQHRIYTPKEARARAKRDGIRTVPAEWKVPTAFSYLEDDPTAALIFGLESYDETTGKTAEQQILHGRILERRELPTHADSIEDAVAIAFDTDALLNLDRVADLLKVSRLEAAVKMERAELAYRCPDSPGTWIPRHLYLSGNVRAKLVHAREAAERDRTYEVNVAALEAVQPVDLDYRDIRLRVGATWVPAEVYAEFLHDIGFTQVIVEHAGGTVWEVRGAKQGTLATLTWGTEHRPAQDLFQALLGKRDSAIRVTHTTATGEVVEDRPATAAAQEKAQRLAQAFDNWVWKDPERRERLARIYNDTINCLVETRHPDTPLVLPGLASDWTMRPHQNSTIRRILHGSTLLDHGTGFGKTAIFAAAAMELRRTKLATKPVIVVQKNKLVGWVKDFRRLYPNAKLLAANASDLGARRAKFMARAAGGDWDAVIMTHSAFERLPLRKQAQEAYIDRELSGIRTQIIAAKNNKMDAATLRRVQNAMDTAEQQLKQRIATDIDDAVSFEDLGIDYILYDEPHESIKNLLTPSVIPGAAITGSARATKAHMLIDYVRRTSHTGHVVSFATATPITNSMTEIYIQMRYLAPEILEETGLTTFDTFVGVFGEVKTSLEPDPRGNGYIEKARLAKFLNVPELVTMYRGFADVRTEDDLELPLPVIRVGADGQPGEKIVIPATENQLDYLRSMIHEPWIMKQAGTIKALGMGLRASTDMRLVDCDLEDGSKLPTVIDNLLALYHETKNIIYPVSAEDLTPQPLPGAFHGVFLNDGTPGSDAKVSVNLYEYIREQLVSGQDGRWGGVPREKIRFIHEARTDAQKEKLYTSCRNGEVLFLIGSDKMMGTGLNIQDRFYSLHHVSFPWTPAALDQDLGRMKRQGNLNHPDVPGTPHEVRRFFYIVEETFDEFRLTTLLRKSHFIEQLKKRSGDLRELEDLSEDTVMLSTLNGLASGDPTIKQRADATAARGRYESLARTHDEEAATRARKLDLFESTLAAAVPDAAAMRVAADRRQSTLGEEFMMTVDGREFRDRTKAGAALRAQLKQYTHEDFAAGPIVIGVLGALPVQVDSTSLAGMYLGFGWESGRCPAWDLWGELPKGRSLVLALERVLSKLDIDIADLDKRIAHITRERDLLAAEKTGDNHYRLLAQSKEREETLLGELIIANQSAAELRRVSAALARTTPSANDAQSTASQQQLNRHEELELLCAKIEQLKSAVSEEHARQQRLMTSIGSGSATTVGNIPVGISAAAAGHCVHSDRPATDPLALLEIDPATAELTSSEPVNTGL